MSKQDDRRGPLSPMSMLGLGLDAAVSLLLFLFLGYKADGWLDSTPWMTVVGAFVGMAVERIGYRYIGDK